MESEAVFPRPYSRWLPVVVAWLAGLPAMWLCGWLRPWRWRSVGGLGPVILGLAVVVAIVAVLVAHLGERRRCRDTWVRVRWSGLTVSSPGAAVEELEWTQIASVVAEDGMDGEFPGLTISTTDGRSVDVSCAIERGEELCQAIWDTGRFVSTGGDSETRWVPKQPEPLPAPQAGSS